MTVQINYLTVVLAAALLSAIGSLMWAAGRSLLTQYGTLLRDQLTEHRHDSSERHAQLVRRLEALEASQKGHAARVDRMEHGLEMAPSHDDLKRIHARIDKVIDDVGGMSGEVRALAAELRSANKALNLIHEHLLNNGAK